jgi:hypothetical protein
MKERKRTEWKSLVKDPFPVVCWLTIKPTERVVSSKLLDDLCTETRLAFCGRLAVRKMQDNVIAPKLLSVGVHL